MFGVTKAFQQADERIQLGIQRFTTKLHSGDGFTTAQKIAGRFHQLESISHPFLAKYVHLSNNATGEIFIVSTICGKRFIDLTRPFSLDSISKWTVQLISALDYLHQQGISCRNLSIRNLYLQDDSIVLCNYGLSFLTNHGDDVEFPICEPRYLCPEFIKNSFIPIAKADVWELGAVLFDFCTTLILDESIESIFHTSRDLSSIDIDSNLKLFIECCMKADINVRPTLISLYSHPFVSNHKLPILWAPRPHIHKNQSIDLKSFFPTCRQLFVLWKVLGGDLEIETKTAIAQPAILSIPHKIRIGDDIEQKVLEYAEKQAFRNEFKIPRLDTLKEKLSCLKNSPELFESVKNSYQDDWKKQLLWSSDTLEEIWKSYDSKPSQLFATEKERDFNYQFVRIFQFRELLYKFPRSSTEIHSEAVRDIPFELRGLIWGALLGIEGDPVFEYECIDTSKEMPTDRQLDLDIPRCHQYEPVLSTPIGHQKLKRVLKAWIECEKDNLVYWQGLDSLCACFVTLNFNDEAMAFSSMRKFINRFCKGFFVADNSKLMRQYMQSLSHLLSFHEPELSHHLHHIGIGPEFYAISWFMTLFARKSILM